MLKMPYILEFNLISKLKISLLHYRYYKTTFAVANFPVLCILIELSVKNLI